jgi:hypothetical protein
LGQAQVVDGEGTVRKWYANGQIREEGTISKGRREGYWHGFQEDGEPYFEEYYRDNRLLRGISIIKGERYVYDQSSEFPFPVMGMSEYNRYLRENTKSCGPAAGVVKVIFQVGQDGSIWDFVVLQSLSPECDQEAIRLIKEGPPWRPAKLHGHRNIPSQGYVEVEF